MWNKSREMKLSYIVMKLDIMLAQHRAMGIVDLEEMHTFVAQFRHLDKRRQQMYGWMLDEMAEMWDSFDEVTNV